MKFDVAIVRTLTACLLLALSAAPMACGGDGDASPGAPPEGQRTIRDRGPRPVNVMPATPTTLADEIRISATIAPNRRASVSPKIPGAIVEVTKRRGDRVKKDEVLVRLDPTDYELGLQQAEAQRGVAEAATAQARAARDSAAQPLRRFKKLRASGSIPEADLDSVAGAHTVASRAARLAAAQLELAKVGVAAARRQVEETEVKAPFDGYVVQRLADEGEMARAMPPTIVLVVVEAPPYYVEGAVNELDAVRLSRGTKLNVRLDALPDVPIEAEVTQLNAMVDPETRALTFRAKVSRGAEHLRVGMSASAVASFGERAHLRVPRVALVEREGARGVVFVALDGKAARREIQLGAPHGDYFLVESGLETGDAVIVAGLGGIRDGEPVAVKNGGPPAESPSPTPTEDAPHADVTR